MDAVSGLSRPLGLLSVFGQRVGGPMPSWYQGDTLMAMGDESIVQSLGKLNSRILYVSRDCRSSRVSIPVEMLVALDPPRLTFH